MYDSARLEALLFDYFAEGDGLALTELALDADGGDEAPAIAVQFRRVVNEGT